MRGLRTQGYREVPHPIVITIISGCTRRPHGAVSVLWFLRHQNLSGSGRAARWRVEQLEGDVEALQHHTHTYLTGKGEGHNNTKATTGRPTENAAAPVAVLSPPARFCSTGQRPCGRNVPSRQSPPRRRVGQRAHGVASVTHAALEVVGQFEIRPACGHGRYRGRLGPCQNA
jgi:hypothetical protein